MDNERQYKILSNRISYLREALGAFSPTNELMLETVAQLVHNYYYSYLGTVQIDDSETLAKMWEDEVNKRYWLDWTTIFLAAGQFIFKEFLEIDQLSSYLETDLNFPNENFLN